MPYFSVVIPALNEERFLPRLLKNLNQQSFKDFEVFVVDGKSEDKTPELVKNFPASYTLTLLTSEKRNVSHQRNQGAAKSTGKVIIFFDADTQIPKNYLEKIHRVFEINKPHVLTTWIKADSKRPSDRFIATASNLLMEAGKIMGNPGCFGAMTAIKRGVFEDIGGYDEQTPFAEDRQIVANAVDNHYQFMILQKPTYTYSLRRFRKEGTLDTVFESIKMNLSIVTNGFHLQNVNYPMGGHVFKTKRVVTSKSVNQFTVIFRDIKKANEKQRVLIKKVFDQLFN